MKKFIALLVAAVLIVSMVGVLTVFAGCSISGNSEVNAGKTYTYKVKVSASGIYMMGNVVCGGVFSGGTVQFDGGAGGSANQSMSASATISVTVAANAQPGDKGTISLDRASYSFYGDDGQIHEDGLSGSKTVTVVAKSASTPKPQKSANGTPAPATPTPVPTGWALAAIEVPAMAQGAQYSVQAPADTVIPAAVLASLKDKQGVLTVDFGTYTCTINGTALGAIPQDLTGIDLGLTLDKDPALSAAAGGADAYQLHFTHSGALPGRFAFRFKADQNQPGDTVYLYYFYDASGVIEGNQQCVVDQDGYVTVDIYHCSSYFIANNLIQGAAGILTQPEPSATPEPTPEATPVSTPDDSLNVAAMGPVERWFGIPYAPLIASLIAAVLLSMLITMLATHSGLFRRRPKTAAEGLFAPEVREATVIPVVTAEPQAPEATDEDEDSDDDSEDDPDNGLE